MSCTTQERLLEWLEGGRRDEILEAHLSSCTECTDAVEELRGLIGMISDPALPAAQGCVDPGALSSFATDMLPASERPEVIAHLCACAACRKDMLKVKRLMAPPEESFMVKLKIVEAGASRTVQFSDPAVFVGRSPENFLKLDDKKASRKHAELRLTDDSLTITDLESANGTKVNGQKISAPRVLRVGDVVAIGLCEIVVEQAPAPAVPVEAPVAKVAPAPEPAPAAPARRRGAVARATAPTPAWQKYGVAAALLVGVLVVGIIGIKVLNSKPISTAANNHKITPPVEEVVDPVSDRGEMVTADVSEAQRTKFDEAALNIEKELQQKNFTAAQKVFDDLKKKLGRNVMIEDLADLREQINSAIDPEFSAIDDEARKQFAAGKKLEAVKFIQDNLERFAGTRFEEQLQTTATSMLQVINQPELERIAAEIEERRKKDYPTNPGKAPVPTTTPGKTPGPAPAAAASGLIDPALARLIAGVKGGELKTKSFTLKDKKVAVTVAEVKEGVTLSADGKDEKVAWAELDPAFTYDLLAGCSLGKEDRLVVAKWAYGKGLRMQGDKQLYEYWDRGTRGDLERKDKVDALLAELRGESKPSDGYAWVSGTGFEDAAALAKRMDANPKPKGDAPATPAPTATTTANPKLLASSLKPAELANGLVDAGIGGKSSKADDLEFLRRAHIDLWGVIPSAEEAVIFMKKRNRAKLIEDLLADKRFGENWADLLARMWINDDARNENDVNRHIPAFKTWLAGQLNKGLTVDKIVTDMISANGPIEEKPQVIYTVQNARKQQGYFDAGSDASAHFMGIQISCAQCHDHPFAKWTQVNFNQMAAFFTGSRAQRRQDGQGAPVFWTVSDEGRGNTGQSPKFYGEGDPQGEGSRRAQFAQLLVSKQNRQFARAIVNRVWSILKGRGVVHPANGFDDNNKPSHPELLEQLAVAFTNNDYDLKWLIRSIMNSATYQQSCETRKPPDPKAFQVAAMRPMTAVQMADSLARVVGVDDKTKWPRDANGKLQPPYLASEQARRRLEALFDVNINDIAASKISIQQALTLMNADDLHRSLQGMAQNLCERIKAPGARIEYLYLSTLSRPPTGAEAKVLGRYAQSVMGNQPEGYVDVAWILINSSEFIYNH